MNKSEFIQKLSVAYPGELATDLIDTFLDLKLDVISSSYGRSSPGKFVETVVQVLQFLVSGTYEKAPNVDAFLRDSDNKAAGLDDGLRICVARVARAMYALRSKRNIVHKGAIDPNDYDLRLLYSAAQWILAELVRVAQGMSMGEAGRLIEEIQAPADQIVERFEGKMLVLGSVSIKEEVLLFLLSNYPETTELAAIVESMKRRKGGSVRNSVRELWKNRLIETGSAGYILTQTGLKSANDILRSRIASQ